MTNTKNLNPGTGTSASRFLERRIVIRGQPQAITLSYGDEVRTFVTVTLTPRPGDLGRIQHDTGCLHALAPVDLTTLGDALARILFPSAIRAQFEADCDPGELAGRCLRLGILDVDAVFPDWPWEYVWLPALDFVALSPFVSLQRLQAAPGSAAATPLTLPDGESLQVLIVYADPPLPGCAPLAADAEVDGLRNQMRRYATRLEPRVLWPAGRSGPLASRHNLADEVVQRPPHILIFMSHGDYDVHRREGVVYLESEHGAGADPVAASELAAILNRTDTPCLVLLDACWTAYGGMKAGGKSVAAALTLPHRIVVGMQGLWPAAACVPFWSAFFATLLNPSPVDHALSVAREVMLRVGSSTPDWGRAALHRSAAPPPAPSIRTRSARPPSTLQAVMSACEAWIRQHVPDAAGSPLDFSPLRKSLGSLLPGQDPRDQLTAWLEGDPLYIMLAAEEDEAPLTTTPIWFTSLRDVPQRLRWHDAGEPGPWRVRLRAASWPDVPELPTASPEVALPEALRARWPGAERVRWEVFEASHDDQPCVAGLIQVLSPEVRLAAEERLRAVEESALEANDPPTRYTAAKCCLELELFEESLGHAGKLLLTSDGDDVRFLTHRLIAQAYRQMAMELQKRPGLQQESLWAATLARWHVRASYPSPLSHITHQQCATC